MRKRFAAFAVFVFATVLSALPAPAWAVEHKGINVNGVDIVADADHIVKCGDGTAEYDPVTGELTLTDAKITKGTGYITTQCGIESGRDMSLNIVLVGENTTILPISATSGDSANPVFDGTCGDITISGPGSLEVTSSQVAPNAINAYNSLTIKDGARVTVHSDQSAALCAQNGDVLITGNADVNAETVSGALAISSKDSVVAENGATVVVKGRCYGEGGISVTDGGTLDVTAVGSSYAVDSSGPITVKDSTLNATSTDTVAVYAWGAGALTLTNGTVKASSTNSYALNAGTGGIEMTGGKVALSAPNKYATYTSGAVVAKGGTEINVTNSRNGLAANLDVHLSGVKGTIDVDSAALYSQSSDVLVDQGCDLEISGGITVFANAGSVSFSDSRLDISGTNSAYAVYGNGDVRIGGGMVHVVASKGEGNAEAYALRSGKEIALTGGIITLEGDAGAIDTASGGNLNFGGTNWYQWATSPAGAVTKSESDAYDSAGRTDTYLRIEPVGTKYGLAVSGGKGSGSYVAGTQVTISADAFNASGHFSEWTVSDPTGAGVLAKPSAAETTFTMPAGAVELTANYEPHAVLEHVAAVDPTCTDAGKAEHWMCPDCGALFLDDDGTNLVDSDDLTIPATGHSWSEPVWSWSEDGTAFIAKFTCANDSKHIETRSAEPAASVETEPTCTEAGVRLYTATVEFNGEEYTAVSREAISALGHDYVDGACTRCGAADPASENGASADGSSIPATGDALLPIAGVVLAGSMLCLGVAFRLRRR